MPLNGTTIYIAIELSTSSWVVATRLPGVAKSKMHRIYAGDTAALLALGPVDKPETARCWPHRCRMAEAWPFPSQ